MSVTRPEVTLLDMAGVISPRVFQEMVDDFVGGSTKKLEQLSAWHARAAGQGRAGSVLVASELGQRGGTEVPQNRLERRFYNLLSERGFPVPVSQFRPWWAPSQRIDGEYFNEKILLEFDGRQFHARVEAFEADRTRHLRSAARKWMTLRINWLQLTRDPRPKREEQLWRGAGRDDECRERRTPPAPRQSGAGSTG